MNGTDILLLANTGTLGNVTLEVVGSQRGVTFDETDAGINASSKDERKARAMTGRYGAKLKLGGLYVPSQAAYLALRAALRTGELIVVRRQQAGAALEEGLAQVNKLGRMGPDQEEAEIGAALTMDGEWTPAGQQFGPFIVAVSVIHSHAYIL
jgi:hypothetical protein